MELIFPSTFSLKEVNPIIASCLTTTNTDIYIDISNVNYVDSAGANLLLLIPYALKKGNNNVVIKVNSTKDSYSYLKHIGVIQKLESVFHISDVNTLFYYDTSPILLGKNQRRHNKHLNFNPYSRTYFTQSAFDVRVLDQIRNDCIDILSANIATRNRISTCITELINNVFDHSERQFAAISIHMLRQYGRSIPHLHLAVTDLGIGIKRSLLKSSVYSEFHALDDTFFISEAMKFNISSTQEASRGFGLHFVSKNCDRMSISSGEGAVSIFNDAKREEYRKPRMKEIESFKGTNINCILKLYN